jgi:hypothetical protein
MFGLASASFTVENYSKVKLRFVTSTKVMIDVILCGGKVKPNILITLSNSFFFIIILV